MNAQPQHMAALASGNAKRFAAAEVKRKIRAGEMTVAQALASKKAESAKVVDLLTAQRRWGVVRAERALERAGEILWGAGGARLTSARHVGDLSARARRALAEAVEDAP